MKFRALPLAGAHVIEPDPHVDERGMFARVYCQNELAEIGLDAPVAQVNHSRNSLPGTLRGMHFQYPPKAETKIVKCVRGAVFDVIVDIRQGSPTFLGWHGEVLSADNMLEMFIPPGFAHGFQVLEPDSELIYLHTEFYSPGHEGGFGHDDPRVGIHWPRAVTVLSDRDASHPALSTEFSGIEI